MEQHSLTEREREVAAQLLQGDSNKEIAATLHISERTVEFHLSNIYQKLGVSSRVELILLLLKRENARLRQKLAESTGDNHATTHDNQNIRSKRVAASLPKGMFMMFKPHLLIEFFPVMLKRYKAIVGFLFMVGVSLFTGYLMVQQGLYFGISYLFLVLVLGSGSLLFGWFWQAIFKNRIGKRPFFLFLLTLSIMLGFVALLDVSLIHTIARSMEKVSISLPGLYNEAQWMQNEAGESYLFRQQHRWVGIPYWLLIVPFMTLFALLGDRWRRRATQGKSKFAQ